MLPIMAALGALTGYSLCSQSLAWYFISFYSSQRQSLGVLGLLSSCGALGLGIGQFINLPLLFRFGSQRMVFLSCFLLGCLTLSALVSPFYLSHLVLRMALGLIDGMIFLVIESALVFHAPLHWRSAALSAYLFIWTLCGMLAPSLAIALLAQSASALIFLLLFLACAPLFFLKVPPFLQTQSSHAQLAFGELRFIRQGFLGAALCVLAGVLSPLWHSLSLSYIQSHPALLHAPAASIVTAFLASSLLGQLSIIWLKNYCTTPQMAWTGLSLSAIASFVLISPAALSFWGVIAGMMVFSFSFAPLYGLGLDWALESIEPSHWVRANKTFLSCYTLSAIFSPLLFPLTESVSLILSLPMLSFVSCLLSLCLILGSFSLKRPRPLQKNRIMKKSVDTAIRYLI